MAYEPQHRTVAVLSQQLRRVPRVRRSVSCVHGVRLARVECVEVHVGVCGGGRAVAGGCGASAGVFAVRAEHVVDGGSVI